MKKTCLICGGNVVDVFCPSCGFDTSLDYLTYPTFMAMKEHSREKLLKKNIIKGFANRNKCESCSGDQFYYIEGDLVCSKCFHRLRVSISRELQNETVEGEKTEFVFSEEMEPKIKYMPWIEALPEVKNEIKMKAQLVDNQEKAQVSDMQMRLQNIDSLIVGNKAKIAFIDDNINRLRKYPSKKKSGDEMTDINRAVDNQLQKLNLDRTELEKELVHLGIMKKNLQSQLEEHHDIPEGKVAEKELSIGTTLRVRKTEPYTIVDGVLKVHHKDIVAEYTDLKLYDVKVRNIREIRYFKKLKRIHLYNNDLEDLSGIEFLTELTTIVVVKNRVNNLETLRNLNKLDIIDLSENKIMDIEPLCGLTQLRHLTLDDNSIVDLKSIGMLKSLSHLNIERNRIPGIELKALLGLSKLSSLKLKGNPINEFDFYVGQLRMKIKNVQI